MAMAPELPEFLEDALAELLWRSTDDASAAFERLLGEHPEHAGALQARWRTYGPRDPAAVPERIGGYEVVREIGQGGMGRVYLARQSQPVRRLVALKVIKLGMDSEQILARFELERQALAVMDHDGIARIFHAGTTERGQPFFAMEFIEGSPITAYCDVHRLRLADRIALFQRVCAAVQHAHEKGVIHRDLKPGNVLVTSRDGAPVPKVIDFGLARATDRQLVGQTLHTLDGQVLGTPEYMSPEQAGAEASRIDTRSDVYSLGVVLYELLTGRLPFASRDLARREVAEVQRILRDSEPPRPGAVRSVLRGDLEWIVLRAMAKDPARRYASPAALAADLQRYLQHEPVAAGPPSATYRIGKFLRRNRTAVVAAGLVLVVASVGLTFAVRFALEASRESAARRTLDLVALPVRLETARAEAERALPAWPEHAAHLDRWVRQWETVAVTRASLAALMKGRSLAAETAEALQRAQAAVEAFLAPEGLLRRMRRERDWAGRVRELTLQHPLAPTTWAAARAAIAGADGVSASALYAATPIELPPQWGLVPIGMNPATKLWEFYHLRSAWDPDGDVDPAALPIPSHLPAGDGAGPGRIAVGADTGIVFVLLPGARDADGSPIEPFFIARHELTQGQWLRLAGEENPSMYRSGLDHPVECVSPLECADVLRVFGLDLPTPTQWHYADRGGAETARFRPDDPMAWEGYANVLDELGAARHNWLAGPFPFSDGHADHAPVGAFRANPFGLHDTGGNVWEFGRATKGYRRLGGSYTSAPPNITAEHLTANEWLKDEFSGVRAVRAVRR